jgi:hypothetical protein
MKDSKFTVRAALGSASGVMGNPFTVQDLPGKLTRTVDAGVVSATGTPARTGVSPGLASATSTSQSEVESLSTGAKAGFGVGIGVGVVGIAIAAVLIARTRRKTVEVGDVDAEKRAPSPAELHDDEANIHQIASKAVYPENEMPGCEGKRFELGVRASTWLVELPGDKSSRNSRTRT